jgi:hypothetical protein
MTPAAIEPFRAIVISRMARALEAKRRSALHTECRERAENTALFAASAYPSARTGGS